MIKTTPILLGLLILQGFITVANAADTSWKLCNIPEQDAAEEMALRENTIDLSADTGQFNGASGKGLFQGNVDLVFGSQKLKADSLDYFQEEGRVDVLGNVTYQDRGFKISGRSAHINLETEYGEFLQTTYQYTPRHARGKATRIVRESQDVIALKDATYTTCNPGKRDWLLQARNVTLDRETGDGTATNAILRFQEIPFLYIPWIRFPIDDRRKSGLLVPELGTSTGSGIKIGFPIYLNLAPNYDAIITPRLLTERGLQLGTKFRYLTSESRGHLDFDFIHDTKKDDDRFLVAFKDKTTILPRLRSNVDFNYVSDESYIEDFGLSLSEASTTHLQKRFDLLYDGGFWNLRGRVQGFQTIDRSISAEDRPYARLPQFVLNSRWQEQSFGLGYQFRSEWVHFDRGKGPTGDRLDTLVGIDRPFVKPGYFFTPSAKLQFTNYQLRELNTPGIDDSPTRILPKISLDSGMIFERLANDGETLVSIEPRLFYLYTPFREQKDIPVFDTTELDFTFAQLFREDRFIGGDRRGDANQLTLALTGRWLDTQSGREKLTASIGQILFFEDRKVTLPSTKPDDSSRSDVVSELSYRIDKNWSARGITLWDTSEGEFQRASAYIRFNKPGNHVFNIGYSFRRDELEQTDLAFAWPLGRRWLAIGRWNYDLREDRHLEILTGLEYESCCWKARLVSRRFISTTEGEFKNSIEAQLILKGLAKLGTPLGKILERGILGFDAEE